MKRRMMYSWIVSSSIIFWLIKKMIKIIVFRKKKIKTFESFFAFFLMEEKWVKFYEKIIFVAKK